MSAEDFQDKMKHHGSCSTINAFERQFGKRLNSLRREVGMRVFRDCVRPAWEDPANGGRGAGKWTIVLPDEEKSKAAFRATLAILMAENCVGVNGVISIHRRGIHVLMLWTQSHEQAFKDVFNVRPLVARVAEEIGVPLSASFKLHASTKSKLIKDERKGASGVEDSDYEASPALNGQVGKAEPLTIHMGETSGSGQKTKTAQHTWGGRVNIDCVDRGMIVAAK